MNDRFAQELEYFKTHEKPEAVLLIGEDYFKTQLLVAWTNTSIERIETGANCPDGNENKTWRWLWSQVRFDPDELAKNSGISRLGFEKHLNYLIGNRLIYPDGTMNGFVQRYLREKVLKLFEAKTKRSTNNKST